MKASARVELKSPRHPLLRAMRRALSRGELTADGCCVVEGLHLVEEALHSRVEVVALVGAQSAQAAWNAARRRAMVGRAPILSLIGFTALLPRWKHRKGLLP